MFAPTGCTPVWNSFNNTNVLGGTQQAATVNTLALCQAACIASATCIGVDFNSLDSSCYFTGTGTRNNGTATGITHFDLVSRCAGKSSFVYNDRVIRVPRSSSRFYGTVIRCLSG